MKRSLTTLCLLLCLTTVAAAQQGPNANATGTPNVNAPSTGVVNSNLNPNVNASPNANINGAANGNNNGNTNPLTIEVRPGQTAKITVGKKDEDEGGLSPLVKDLIDVLTKILGLAAIVFTALQYLRESRKNRRERLNERRERAERRRKERAENEKDRGQSELNRQQREQDVEQRKTELRWKKAELAKEVLKELHTDPYAVDAMLMLDWNGRVFHVKASRNHPDGLMEKISSDEMWAALRVVELHFNDKERFIRDCFDAFFGQMQIIEHYISIDLIELADVAYPFDYYLDALGKNEFMFDNFVAAYHPRAASFIRRLKEFTSQKEATSPPGPEYLSPPDEVVSPPDDAEGEQGAFFLFDCPPRSERFVLFLDDPSKIAEARAILSDEYEAHIDGDIVDSHIYYNEPWNFYVDPASVNFLDDALAFAEQINQRVEARLGVGEIRIIGTQKRAVFSPNNIWHMGGARLLAQLPPFWFDREREGGQGEQVAALWGQGRVDDSASGGDAQASSGVGSPPER
jgi:hypothetical protein